MINYKVKPKKYLGQHFLKGTKVCDRMLSQAGIGSQDVVVEIGSGFGALTIPTSKLVSKLFTIEKDVELAKVMGKKLLDSCIDNVELIIRDIMDVDLNKIYEEVNRKLVLLGNIPYNISSEILIKTIQNKDILSKAVLMVQKEVADRVCSTPGSKNYGRLSVVLQYNAKLCNILEVEPQMFFPKPKVKSSVIEITFSDKPNPIAKDEKILYSVVKAAFSKRRKIIKNSLLDRCSNVNECNTILEIAGINPMRRAETLSVKEFVKLSDCFYELQ